MLLAPVLFILVGLLNNTRKDFTSENLITIILVVVFGLLFSLPVYALNVICYKICTSKLKSGTVVKVIINVVSIVGTILILLVVTGPKSFSSSAQGSGFLYGLVYAASILISSLFYRVDTMQRQS